MAATAAHNLRGKNEEENGAFHLSPVLVAERRRLEMVRACGDCTLCCKLIPVEELGKLAGQRCQHVKTGKGCTIYRSRPWSCREWSCMWLTGTEHGGPLDLRRPDRAHYVIDTVPDIIRMTFDDGRVDQIDVLQVWCDPKFPDAWKDPALLDMLDRVGVVALVRYNSEKGFAAFPPSRSADKQWHFTDSTNAPDMVPAQRAARREFWTRAAKEQRP